MQMPRVLCIDDDDDFLVGLSLQIRDFCHVTSAKDMKEAHGFLGSKKFDLVLLDIGLGSENGIDGISAIKKANADIDVVMLSGRRDARSIVNSMNAGAVDYLTKPFDPAELRLIIERLAKERALKEKYEALIESQNPCAAASDMIFESASMRRMLRQAEQLKGHFANVLIVGESGTGKELLARYIHRLEANSKRPFVAVNCAAIPEQLLEAELFGAEAGAFTGALKRRIGKFELADGGDIFLDEIGALRLDLQAKILRVLQEQEFNRLGGNDVISAHFRVVSATNESLEEKVSRGEFRMDLYHRIRVIQLRIPPLRERLEDIPALVEHYLKKLSNGSEPKTISPEAISKLMSYDWPGNVRELANVVHSLLILSKHDVIDEKVFPSWTMNGCGASKDALPIGPTPLAGEKLVLKEYLANAEKTCIVNAIAACKGDKTMAARMLQIGRTTLYSKIKELGICET